MKLVEGPALRDCGQTQRVLGRPGEVLRVRRRQRALGAARGIERQIHRPLEKRRRSSLTTARSRANRRSLELIRDLVIWTRRGQGAMPRPAVRVGLGVRHLGDRRVRPPPLIRRPRRVCGGADERMPEPDPSAELAQPRLYRGRPRLPADPLQLGGPPHHAGLAEWVGCSNEQQPPRLLGQRHEPAAETLLDPVGERWDSGRAESGELGGAQGPGELEQRQWVTARLSDDAVAHLLVQPESHRRAQQRARVAVAQTHDRELGQVPELIARFAGSEHQTDGFGQQATRDERERQRRALIQPLRIVDDTEHRTLLGRLRQHAQHRQAHEEPIRRLARAQPEHDLERLTLRSRKPIEPVEQRPAQLMQTRVAELHLRLHAHRRTTVTSDAASIRYCSRAVFPIPASPRSTNDRLSPRRIDESASSSSAHSLERPNRPVRWPDPGTRSM